MFGLAAQWRRWWYRGAAIVAQRCGAQGLYIILGLAGGSNAQIAGTGIVDTGVVEIDRSAVIWHLGTASFAQSAKVHAGKTIVYFAGLLEHGNSCRSVLLHGYT